MTPVPGADRTLHHQEMLLQGRLPSAPNHFHNWCLPLQAPTATLNTPPHSGRLHGPPGWATAPRHVTKHEFRWFRDSVWGRDQHCHQWASDAEDAPAAGWASPEQHAAWPRPSLRARSRQVWVYQDFPGGSGGKASASNAGDPGSSPGSGRSPGEGNGSPIQYCCLENPMD